MKYVGYYEAKPEIFDKIVEKFQKAAKIREKEPDKFPKMILPPHTFIGQWTGFLIYDDPTPEQLTNVTLHYRPELKFKFMPVVESTKVMETFLKSK